MISKIEELSAKVFAEYFLDWLCFEHFQKPITSSKSVERYFQEFSKFTDRHFIEVCNQAFNEKYLPSVNWFLDQRQLIVDREYREANVFRPEPPISEEQRLRNVDRLQDMFKKFQQSSSF
jgi:hypothetical protein